MNSNDRIKQALEEARAERRLAHVDDPTTVRAVQRKIQAGELVTPYRGLFISSENWVHLNELVQVDLTICGIFSRHPETVFAGPTAVRMYGLEHQYAIHRPGIFTLGGSHGTPRAEIQKSMMERVNVQPNGRPWPEGAQPQNGRRRSNRGRRGSGQLSGSQQSGGSPSGSMQPNGSQQLSRSQRSYGQMSVGQQQNQYSQPNGSQWGSGQAYGGQLQNGNSQQNGSNPQANGREPHTAFAPRRIEIAVPKTRWAEVTTVSDRGYRVTTLARTLVDCAVLLSFPNALAIFDDALKKNLLDEEAVIRESLHVRGSEESVKRLLKYMNAASANGGESLTRGVMIEEGFALPILQRHFPSCDKEYRAADFCWPRGDGTYIVGELDGEVKVNDPAMTQGRTPQQIANETVLREQDLLVNGASRIFRLTIWEVIDRIPMIQKMEAAGVPRSVRPFPISSYAVL